MFAIALASAGMSGHEEDGAAPTRPWILLVSPAIALGGEPLDQRGGLGADWRPSHPVQVGQLIMETGGASGLVIRSAVAVPCPNVSSISFTVRLIRCRAPGAVGVLPAGHLSRLHDCGPAQ